MYETQSGASHVALSSPSVSVIANEVLGQGEQYSPLQ